MQLVELHYREKPSLDQEAIVRRAQELTGGAIDSPRADGSDSVLLFHRDSVVEYTDGAAPAQTSLLFAYKIPDAESYTAELQQSWACPHAPQLLIGSSATLLVTEMMARGLPHQERVRLFHAVLQAVVEATAPVAMVFKHSQQVVDPEAYLSPADESAIMRAGALNVRFFNVEDAGGEMVMDTRGLEEIGLHDLQCHFQGLEPNGVSRVLFNTAIYLFEKGPVFESGHTIQGIEEGSKWECHFESALVEPKRDLLDLNPGAPYSNR